MFRFFLEVFFPRDLSSRGPVSVSDPHGRGRSCRSRFARLKRAGDGGWRRRLSISGPLIGSHV